MYKIKCCRPVWGLLLLMAVLPFMKGMSQNRPIVQTKFTADPAPMVHDGTVYLYISHDEDDAPEGMGNRSEEHTSELQSRPHLVCRLLLEKKKQKNPNHLHIY